MEFNRNIILHRPRRLRKSTNLRSLVRENHLHLDDLISPIFIVEGNKIKNPIPSMPGIYQWSIDMLEEEISALIKVGISRVLIFGIPKEKDEVGADTYSESGIIQKAIKKIKSIDQGMLVITDLCFCEYMNHGHCGIVSDGGVNNDATVSLLAKQAISHALAGADIVAPSSMMDGMVKGIRKALDSNGFEDVLIMSYAVKYSSSFYGPFRDAVDSTPQFGDRNHYQMDYANSREAIREVELDIREGADIVMVKPALSYLDIVYQIKNISNIPVACYNVSGEYSMIMAASKEGWLDHDRIVLELLLSIKRAGADIIISYFAKKMGSLINQRYE